MIGRTWRLEIDWCSRPISANAWYGANRWDKAALVAEWKNHAVQAARLAKLPRGIPGFEIALQFRYSKGALTDPDAAAPCSKAIVDGLVTGPKAPYGYGLCPDDNADFFYGTHLLPSILDRSKRDAVIVIVREVIDQPQVIL